MQTHSSSYGSIVFLAIHLLCSTAVKAQCVATSWQNATSFSIDNSIGVYDFSLPGNAQNSDNSRASASSLISILSGNTHYLKATGFNFSIPTDASICGVTVEIEYRADGLLLTAAIRDNEVKLIKNNIITGDDYALPGNWGSSDIYRSYGGSADLWGTTLTPAEVNGSNFGVAFSARIIALIAALPSAEIDHIRMRIHYNLLLPVTLHYFKATKKGSFIDLEWKTTEEEDNAFIIVQRSVNNGSWKNISQYRLQGHSGGNLYRYTDTVVTKGNYQYRLQMVLPSGQIKYSNTKQFVVSDLAQLQTYPNPAKEKITITTTDKVIINDLWGRCFSLPTISQGTTTTISIHTLPAGIYFIKAGSDTVKFIKD